jgi:hypothetical protein
MRRKFQPVGHFKAIAAPIARVFAPAEVSQNLQRGERRVYITQAEMARAALERAIAQWIEEHDR